MLGALAVGETRVEGLLEGEDVLATAAAMRAMGSRIERAPDGAWHIHGVGVGGLLPPTLPLDMGNSGTSARLIAGLIASHAIEATLVGDASLSARPMQRIIEPLSRMGARFTSRGGRLPLHILGRAPATPIAYRMPVASAQVKTAVLLAGLNAPGITRVIEPAATRDHGERMLAAFGAEVETAALAGGGRAISIRGEAELRPQRLTVPGDISSAAFPLVAAALIVLARKVRARERRASVAIHSAFGTQILLGIATVMTGMNIILAVLHQAVGALVVVAFTWGAHVHGRAKR